MGSRSRWNDRYLENPELLNALVSEKLKLAEKELQAEGWGWVRVDQEHDWQVTFGCSRIEPEIVDAPQELLDEKAAIETELDAIEERWDEADPDDNALLEEIQGKQADAQQRLDSVIERLQAYARFNPEQMKLAGCYAYIDHGGTFEVERGLVKREARKALAAASPTPLDDDQPAEKPKGIPESLKRDLEAYRLHIAQAEIAMHPEIAFDLLVFNVACDIFHSPAFAGGVDVNFRQSWPSPSVEGETLASKRLETIKEGLPVAWTEIDDEGERFLAFRQLSREQKYVLPAYCTAMTLKPELAQQGAEPGAYDVALAQTGVDVAEYWRPTKDNSLSRIPKDQLLEVGRELIGGERGETWAAKNANEKKGEIAGELHKAFSDPDRYGGTPDLTDRVKNWLLKAGCAGAEARQGEEGQEGSVAKPGRPECRPTHQMYRGRRKSKGNQHEEQASLRLH